MQPNDIGGLITIGAPAISPDGRRVAFTVRRVDLPGNRYISQVWLYDTAGGSPRPLTRGDKDGGPVWSPDGSALAFTSRARREGGGRHAPRPPDGRPGRSRHGGDHAGGRERRRVVARRAHHRLLLAHARRSLRQRQAVAPAASADHAPLLEARRGRVDGRSPTARLRRPGRWTRCPAEPHPG